MAGFLSYLLWSSAGKALSWVILCPVVIFILCPVNIKCPVVISCPGNIKCPIVIISCPGNIKCPIVIIYHVSCCCDCLRYSGGGWVLSKSVSRWKGIAVYSPIINGW